MSISIAVIMDGRRLGSIRELPDGQFEAITLEGASLGEFKDADQAIGELEWFEDWGIA